MHLVCVKIRLRLPVIFFRPAAYVYIPIWRPLKKPSNEPLHKVKTYYFSAPECCSFLYLRRDHHKNANDSCTLDEDFSFGAVMPSGKP